MNKNNILQTRRAFCLFALGALCCRFPVAAFSAEDAVDLSKWAPSSSRKAGTRQTLKIGKTEIGLVWIPAGEFDMGSPETERWRNLDENQIHVKLTRGFWMLETEVTQGLYQEIMGTNPTWDGYAHGKFLPVSHVQYDDAVKFCEELSKRLPKGLTANLPTEAQWEYACRAGTKTAYWYGNDEDSGKMNVARGGEPKTVKSYPANPWGLYDMHGNVAEWARDWYVKSYSGEFGLGTAVDPEVEEEPTGGYKRRVYRGGSFGSARPIGGATHGRSAGRNTSGTSSMIDVGFRFILVCE